MATSFSLPANQIRCWLQSWGLPAGIGTWSVPTFFRYGLRLSLRLSSSTNCYERSDRWCVLPSASPVLASRIAALTA